MRITKSMKTTQCIWQWTLLQKTLPYYHCIRPPAHKHNAWPLYPHSWVPLANAHWAKPGGFDHYNHKHTMSAPLSCTIANRKQEHKCEHHPPTYKQWAAHEWSTLVMIYQPSTTLLTSQCCKAVSIDTCTAVARFFNWFWGCTHTQVAYPRVFAKPVTILIVHTLGHGYGFFAIWVWVALENPRVIHANP